MPGIGKSPFEKVKSSTEVNSEKVFSQPDIYWEDSDDILKLTLHNNLLLLLS